MCHKIYRFVSLSVVFLLLFSTKAFADTYDTVKLENPDTTNWIVWETPDDLKMEGTALDASFILDEYAGVHGAIHTEGEDFVFADGTKAHFNGVNVCARANFPSYEDAEKMATRIARMGFNLVRFHQLELGSSNNIFGKGTVTSTMQIDPGQQDKLFYFMNELKKRGVYFYIDLLTYRTKAVNDPIEDVAVGSGWQQQGHITPDLIGIQKQYINQLINTKNPYTGMTLAEDPAFVLASIVNENGLYHIGPGTFTGIHEEWMNAYFASWLGSRYSSSDQMLREAWAESGKVGLKEGESIENRTVNILGNEQYGIPEIFTQENYSTKRINDTWEFLMQMTRNYYADITNYIKNELGAKCMITGTPTSATTEYMATLRINKEQMDFTDSHSYQSHPLNGLWFEPGSSSWNDAELQTPYLFEYIAGNRVQNQPFVISEWNEGLTNDFHSEMPIMMATFAAWQNWNPIQFTLMSDPPSTTKGVVDCFEIYEDPGNTVLWPTGNLIFHRREIPEPTVEYYNAFTQQEALTAQMKQPLGYYQFLFGKYGIAFSDMPDFDANKSSSTASSTFHSSFLKDSGIGFTFGKKDGDNRSFTVDTDYTNSVTAFMPNTTYDFGESQISFTNSFANVAITSVTNESLASSDRLLISTVARSRNTGETFQYSLTSNGALASEIVSCGTAPVLAEPVNATVTLKNVSENVAVYALNSHGERTAVVPVSKSGSNVTVNLDGSIYKALNYEVVKGESDIGFTVAVNDDSTAMEINGFIPAASVNVTVKAPSGATFYNGVVNTDSDKSFNLSMPFDKKAEYGNYTVSVSQTGYTTTTKTVVRRRVSATLSVDSVVVGEMATVSGTFYLKEGEVGADKLISVAVAKADSGITESSQLSPLNAYYFDQVRTDSKGMFHANINLFAADGGEYRFFLMANAENGEGASYTDTYTYTPDAYRLHLYSNGEKSSVLYNVPAGKSITAVARLYNAEAVGVLALAHYDANNKLVNVKMESNVKNSDGELTVSYQVPEVIGEDDVGYVKLFLIENLTSVKPLVKSITISSLHK